MALIDSQLPDLLGNALIDPSGPDYPQERKVVEDLRKGLGLGQAVLLVGYAYGVIDGSDVAQAMVTAAGQAHMDSFNAGENLSRRFAAAAVIDLMQGYVGSAPVAAALASRAAARTELQPVVADLGHVAAASLTRLADAMRAISFERVSVQPFPPGKSSDLPAEGAETVSSSTLRVVVQEQRNAIRAAADSTEKRIRALEVLSLRNSEEIDLLWWALDPFSDYLDEWAYAERPATLLASLEVGRRLLVDPPPRGGRRVLAEALSKAGVDPTERLSLKELVAEVPTDAMNDQLLSGAELGWAAPVLSQLCRRRDGANDFSGDEVLASRLEWAQQLVADLSLKRVMT